MGGKKNEGEPTTFLGKSASWSPAGDGRGPGRREPPEEQHASAVINSTMQNINAVIYIKLLTYWCGNLICLTSALQQRGMDSCRRPRGSSACSSTWLILLHHIFWGRKKKRRYSRILGFIYESRFHRRVDLRLHVRAGVRACAHTCKLIHTC